ncbi:hypothetical protein ACFW2T_25715 [Streptomyces sp. NPDC058892]|uniref:virginiamycin B lyase family protein n=1 Tax=unclassified Streptomyces TaxID=2593676 RepID=UPI0036B37E15
MPGRRLPPAGSAGWTRSPAGGAVTAYPLPDPQCRPHAVAVAPDGACWYTAWATGRIGRVTETALSGPDCEPHGLAFGPDGTLYVAQESGDITRWDITAATGE